MIYGQKDKNCRTSQLNKKIVDAILNMEMLKMI